MPSGNAHRTGDRRDVDDHAVPLINHLGDHMSHPEEHAAGIGGRVPVPRREIEVLGVGGDSYIVDQHVNTGVLAEYLVYVVGP